VHRPPEYPALILGGHRGKRQEDEHGSWIVDFSEEGAASARGIVAQCGRGEFAMERDDAGMLSPKGHRGRGAGPQKSPSSSLFEILKTPFESLQVPPDSPPVGRCCLPPLHQPKIRGAFLPESVKETVRSVNNDGVRLDDERARMSPATSAPLSQTNISSSTHTTKSARSIRS
jgi:hypothetical protein